MNYYPSQLPQNYIPSSPLSPSVTTAYHYHHLHQHPPPPFQYPNSDSPSHTSGTSTGMVSPPSSTTNQPLLTPVSPADEAVAELRAELISTVVSHGNEMLLLQRQILAQLQALTIRITTPHHSLPESQTLHSAPPDEVAPIKTNSILEGDVKQVSDIMVFAASVEHKFVGDGEIPQMAYCHLETEHHMFDKMPERSVSVQQSAVHEGLIGGFPLMQSEVLQQHLGSIVHTKQMDVNEDTQNKFKRIGIGVDSIGTYEANKGAPKVLEDMLDTETEVAYESLLTVLRLELRYQPPSVISDAAEMIVACSNGFEDASEITEDGCFGDGRVVSISDNNVVKPRGPVESETKNISPGPMTLVSNFFAEGGEDYKSFSQLLAGAERSSSDESSGGFRFPADFLDSPGRLFSPGQAAFGMMHQQAQAQVSAQASQSQAYTFHIPNDHSSSMSQLPVFNPTPRREMMTKLTDGEQRLQPSSLTVDKPDDDGYNWRKYGQKQVKGSEFPRSYYKCTHPSCPVKKKVERVVDGQITEIIYKGEHNHQRPQSKRHKDSRNQNGNVQGNHDIASQAISSTSDGEEVGDAGMKVEENDEDEPDAKRRNMEVRQSELASSHRTVTEPRIIVQTTSEVDLLDDGYRWRKYGQKVVKSNPYPRSYYKCTFPGCNVRKHVERAATDPKAVITTYEGKHNHDVPASKSSSYAANNNTSNLVTANQGTQKHASVSRMDPQDNDREPVARLRLKEEQIIANIHGIIEIERGKLKN